MTPKVLYDNAGIPRDELGNEVFPIIINMICPIKKADEARDMAVHYCTNVEGTYTEKSHIMRLNLGPIGTKTITHVGNTQRSYTNILELRVKAMNDLSLPWIATKYYTINDDPNEIKRYFCCIVGNPIDFLSNLGLEVIKS